MNPRPWSHFAAASVVLAGAPLASLAAAKVLPEGVGHEVTPLEVIIRAALIVWAVFLLAFGRRYERLAAGTFFLLAPLAVAWLALSRSSYGAVLVAAYAVYAAGMLVLAFVPRLAMAVACLWPLAGVYAAHIYFTGSFHVSWTLFFCLLAAGAALGALLPKAATVVTGSATGALLILLASPWELGFWGLITAFCAGIIWQAAALPAVFPDRSGFGEISASPLLAKRLHWFGSLKAGAVVMIVGAVLVSLAAPRIKPLTASQKERAGTLEKEGVLSRPGLLLSPADSFYLGGRPVAIALVGKSGSFLNRMLLPVTGRDPSPEIHRLRAIKSPQELEIMRRAAAITSKAFEAVAPMIKPGVNENEVERAILASFAANGANGIAFPCIVGSGHNATLPHYMANDAVMKDGLVVIDIGCALDGYSSDMTRTFPVNGRYTEAEKKLLEVLVQAGDAARAKLEAGASYGSLDKAAREVITKAGFGPYFNHYLGHPVGLDVHDPYRDRLEAGMVVTIEPGIYIPAGSPVDKAYWNLGARIEDSYIVTGEGYEEITSFPKIPPEQPNANQK